MHPSRAIRGTKSRLLDGRRIVVGVSGSIAAVEVPRMVRELLRHGADVRIVATPDALKIITEEALAFASGHPPIRELTGGVEHVALLGPGEGRADLLLIAPATANTISKIAHGIDDTAVTSFASIALGGGVPLLIAPAMHGHLARNPAVRENLDRLRSWGVGLIAPTSAEGEEKLPGPEQIAAAVIRRLAQGPWRGRHVIVVGGASREPIDEVRSITNESSGATAVALAAQAYLRGAEVELWAGALRVPPPPGVPLTRWSTVGDLEALVHRSEKRLRGADAILVPAALADYTLDARRGKISSRTTPRLRLDLRPGPRILPLLRRLAPAPTLLVGFKLEAGLSESALAERARTLREEVGLDEVVANDRANLGEATASFLLVGPGGARHWISGPKDAVAGHLLDALERRLPSPPTVRRAAPAVARTARRRLRQRPHL